MAPGAAPSSPGQTLSGTYPSLASNSPSTCSPSQLQSPFIPQRKYPTPLPPGSSAAASSPKEPHLIGNRNNKQARSFHCIVLTPSHSTNGKSINLKNPAQEALKMWGIKMENITMKT